MTICDIIRGETYLRGIPMGIYSDAFDASAKRLREESLFLYRTILIHGKPHQPMICEKRMIKILEFKGTGVKRDFLEIYREVEEMALGEMGKMWDGNGFKHIPWIDEYIIQNNIQVVFGKDDVKMNPKRVRRN